MTGAGRTVTTVSTKGQVILPKAIRDQRRWAAGTRLIVESTEDGVLLKTMSVFSPTQLAEVFGCLPAPSRPKSPEDHGMPRSPTRSDGGMLAIDANVIVRVLTRDDPGQAERARRLIEVEEVFVSVTVLLETERVLRGAYGYSARAEIQRARRLRRPAQRDRGRRRIGRCRPGAHGWWDGFR